MKSILTSVYSVWLPFLEEFHHRSGQWVIDQWHSNYTKYENVYESVRIKQMMEKQNAHEWKINVVVIALLKSTVCVDFLILIDSYIFGVKYFIVINQIHEELIQPETLVIQTVFGL